ncbi:hypothetical protein GJU40_19910 [Bacillus lacus]|uniref:Uncharacterized protein n=1 Tax=Metabacillus lacus TaxID=1983721 RepID=A0A7X2M1H1_9BACI|nr:hypothetical protein [Metabacillus lacus]MRX74389.1 hypothetical protein [Metabacillus lacus]
MANIKNFFRWVFKKDPTDVSTLIVLAAVIMGIRLLLPPLPDINLLWAIPFFFVVVILCRVLYEVVKKLLGSRNREVNKLFLVFVILGTFLVATLIDNM